MHSAETKAHGSTAVRGYLCRDDGVRQGSEFASHLVRFFPCEPYLGSCGCWTMDEIVCSKEEFQNKYNVRVPSPGTMFKTTLYL